MNIKDIKNNILYKTFKKEINAQLNKTNHPHYLNKSTINYVCNIKDKDYKIYSQIKDNPQLFIDIYNNEHNNRVKINYYDTGINEIQLPKIFLNIISIFCFYDIGQIPIIGPIIGTVGIIPFTVFGFLDYIIFTIIQINDDKYIVKFYMEIQINKD
jgi:hypothetical protein